MDEFPSGTRLKRGRREIERKDDGFWYDVQGGRPVCGRRTKSCSVKSDGCGHRFPASEYDDLYCPECGLDRLCRSFVEEAGRACWLHGGRSLRGIESATFKHGRFSKYLPDNLFSSYVDFMDDPRKLGLDDEMALVRAMIGDRLEDLDGLGSAKTWHQLKKTYGKMMTAQERREKQRFAQYLIEIGEIIDHGHDQTSTRQEIVKLIDSERKLIDTQRQLFIDMGEFITRGMVLLIMRRIMDSVTEEVRELEGGPEAIQSVADTIRGLAGSLRGGRSSTGSVTIDVEQEQLADR